jgi:GNAT superfamily N-acetyltransferase
VSTPTQVRDLRAETDTSLIERVYRDILQPSFDASELEALDVLLDGLSGGISRECWGLCAMDGDTPVGCILGYPYPVSRVLLIGYMAIRPGLRSRGLGRTLLEEARRRWFGTAGLTLVLAEIEDPRYHPAAGGIDPARRVAFYSRLAAQMVVGPYFQLQLKGEGKKRIYGMFLAVLYGGERASVSAPQLAAFLREYFMTAEGSDWPSAGDEEGRWLLDWYRARETVDLRPIAEYSKADIPRVPGRPANPAGSTPPWRATPGV